jgi:hypothetical protein
MDLAPVGRAEDLFALFARREYTAVGPPPAKSAAARGWLEPAFQAFGRALALAGEVLPDGTSLMAQDALYKAIQGGGCEADQPFDPAQPALAEAAALIKEAERRTGRRAAVACLLAHAPVDKEWLHLNPLMFRHALKGLAAVRGGPCRPRLVNAVDAFALDMLDPVGEGAYAGYMSRAHLGFERVTAARPPAGRALTADAGWDTIARRILGLLSDGGELVMVLAGGVPATARGYYALREAVGRLCRESPGAADPKGVLGRLSAGTPSFAAFRGDGHVGDLKSAWRLLEAWVLSLAMTPSGRRALDAGRLDAPAAAGLVAVGAALGVPPADMVAARKTLEAELARETPFRERFLSLLAHRASFARRPVLLLPLVWGRLGAVKVAFGPPACLLPAPRGRAALLGPDGTLVETTAAGWARDFVEARFS